MSASEVPLYIDLSTLGAAALSYARLGWPVLPLRTAGKVPLFPSAHPADAAAGEARCTGQCGRLGHGFWDATTDTAVLARWWVKYPTANVGVAVGAAGLAVVDVDPRHGGWDSLAALESQHGRLPDTMAGLTGGGGLHLIYRAPDRALNRRGLGLGAGIDLKAGTGYIVVPPSLHPDTGEPYRWDAAVPPAAWPEVLWAAPAAAQRRASSSAGHLRQDRRTRPRLEAVLEVVLSAGGGERNTRLFWASCRCAELVAAGVLQSGPVMNALMRAAQHVGLDPEEARATVRSGLATGGGA